MSDNARAKQLMLSKANLLSKVCPGEPVSFEGLFLQHYDRVYGALFRLLGDQGEAEDMAQQVFLKLYHALDHLQAKQDETNLTGWLYRVAVNQGYNALRSRKRRRAWYEQLARRWFPVEVAPDPADLADRREAQAQVRQVLAKMKSRQAKLLLLRHSGLSYAELAAALDIAPTSVGPLLTQAKRTFAQNYRATFPEKM